MDVTAFIYQWKEMISEVEAASETGHIATATKHDVIRHIFLPIAAGMLTAQVIAVLFVYLSNQQIHGAAEALEKNGFFPIPTGEAMASLNSIGAAIGGGLFFTLSIGIGLALVTWGACRIWHLLFKQNRWILAVYGVLWATMLVWINADGWVLFPSLFCVAVPGITGWITISGIKKHQHEKPGLWFVPVVTLVLLTVIWATQFNTHLFVSIRDHILLSNPLGRSVNDFYYRYTLYAAEAFKSFNQKTLRTCRLEGFEDETRRERLKKLLLRRDIVVIPGIDRPDIRLIASNENVRIASPHGPHVDIPADRTFRDMNDWLSEYSKATDQYKKLRRATLIGLLAGFPILLFVIIYGIVRAGLGLMMTSNRAVMSASSLCLIIGILLFLPMLRANPIKVTREGLNDALTSDQWTHRVAGLRFSDTNKIEIARHPAYQYMVDSRLVVERYWLARALARSRVPTTYRHLLTLLKDPHPNVVCQALFALGERKQRQAIDPIKQKLKDVDHWYVQWYGYRALRRLGWHQGQSK